MPSAESWPWKLLTVSMLLLGLEARATGGDPPPIQSGQGPALHGTGNLEDVNIPLQSLDLSQFLPQLKPSQPGGRLICQSPPLMTMKRGRLDLEGLCPGVRPSWLIVTGVAFIAPFEGDTVRFVIKDEQEHNNHLRKYKVMVKRPGDTSETPLCATNNGFALAVPNAWSRSGELLKNPNYFTFTCVPDVAVISESPGRGGGSQTAPLPLGGGAIAKCIDWGYPPWENGPRSEDEALRLHQACVRMATADYCSEGKPNTLDGTPIAFFPLKDVPLDEKDPTHLAHELPDGYALEAVWAINGDGECSKVRPLCLGKKRWSSLSLDATCLDQNALARLGMRLQDTNDTLKTCEEWTLGDLKDGGAMLVSYSTFIDKVLVTFSHERALELFLTTTDTVTRTFVTHAGVKYRADYRADLDGNGKMDEHDYTHFLRVEGSILSNKLPREIKEHMKGFIKPIYRCTDAKGRFLLTDRIEIGIGDNGVRPCVGDGRNDKGVYHIDASEPEGYIYNVTFATSAQGNPRPLFLYRRDIDGSYATTTSTRPPEGYNEQPVRIVGYLPAWGQRPGYWGQIWRKGGQAPPVDPSKAAERAKP